MRKRRVTGLAWTITLVCLGMVITTAVFYFLNETGFGVPQDYEPSPFNLVMAMLFPPAGALILTNRPRHTIGWIFLAIGLIQAAGQAALQVSFYALETRPGFLPFGELLFRVQDTIWFPGFALLVLLIALFPTGSFLTRRWRWLAWMLAAAFGIFVLSIVVESFTDPQPIGYSPTPADPFGVGDVIWNLSLDLLLLSLFAAVISLGLRMRRSRGSERQQLKWFAFAGVIYLVVFTILSILSAWPVLNDSIVREPGYRLGLGLLRILHPLAVALFPLALGIAILRYRLYDIDLIIRRTLIYSILTVILALVYAGGIILLQMVFLRLTGQARSAAATVISTLTIAALFTPLRNRVQGGIDRRFYRRKYDAERTLAAFGASLRDEVDLNTLVSRIETVVEDTLQPEVVSLWLKPITKQSSSSQKRGFDL